MKKLKEIAAGASLLLLLIVACKKSTSSNNVPVPQINIPDSARLGQAVALSVQNIGSGTITQWSVTPNTGFHLDSLYSYGNNTITFFTPGIYKVSVVLNQFSYSTDPIPQPPHGDTLWLATDSTYFPPADTTYYPPQDSITSYAPYYPSIDSTWFMNNNSYFKTDSTFYNSGTMVKFTRTIVVSN